MERWVRGLPFTGLGISGLRPLMMREHLLDLSAAPLFSIKCQTRRN
jgi:hypothetical protein